MMRGLFMPLVVGALFLAALVIDLNLISAQPLPVLYAVPILVTAYYWGPRAVLMVGILAICLFVLAGRYLQPATTEWPLYGSTLVALTALAYLLSMQRLRLRHLELEHRRTIAELQQTLDAATRLAEILVICADCRRVRDQAGQWQSLEEYVEERWSIRFKEGCCPDCTPIPPSPR